MKWHQPLCRFAFCVIILTSGIGCREPAAELPISSANTPDQETTNFELVRTIGDVVHWKLNSAKARIFDNQQRIELTQLEVVFYDTDTKEEASYLIADSGVINDKESFMQAIGNVELKSTDGKILKAPELYWDRRIDQIQCEQEVEVNDGNTVIRGEGLKTDPEMRRMEFSRIKTRTEKPDRSIF
jgi:LPS export ABC transporter protein LptC